MANTYKQQVLDLLVSSTEPIPCWKLAQITHRFGACIFELRQHGYVIDVRKSYDINSGKMHTTYQLVV